MKSLLLKNLPIVITLLFIILAFLYFSFEYSFISLSNSGNEIRTNQISSKIELYQDYNGIFQIIANNEKDAYFALGYQQAYDRLFQMDFLRRKAKGQLSELFGEVKLNEDVFIKLFELEQLSKDNLKYLDKESLDNLNSFSNGINYYIENNRNKLSFEFGLFNYMPYKWEPSDCIVIFKLFTLESSSGIWFDNIFSQIALKIGDAKSEKLLPKYKNYFPTYFDYEKPQKADTISEERFLTKSYSKSKSNISLTSTLNEIFKTRNSFFENSYSTASNLWIYKNQIPNKQSITLANDLHSGISIPSMYYNVHLTFADKNIIGGCISGIPYVMTGRNENLIWGFTNIMYDDFDIYLNKIDSANKDYYYNTTNKKTKFIYIRDSVKIHNKNAFEFYKRRTDKSLVISDITSLSLNVNKSNLIFPKSNNVITYNWTGKYLGNEMDILRKINLNSELNYNEIENSNWISPALNLGYTDRNGNYSFISLGKKASRGKNNVNWKLNKANDSLSGWNKLENITYTFPKDQNRNYLIAANNKISNRDSIEGIWANHSRAKRIFELLKEADDYVSQDFQTVQNDALSEYANEILDKSKPVLAKFYKFMNDKEKKYFNSMYYWDNVYAKFSGGPIFFNIYYYYLKFNLLYDELDDYHFDLLLSNEDLISNVLLECLNDKNSPFIDNIKTKEEENLDFLLIKSFKDAVNYKNIIDNKKIELYWGKNRIIRLNHNLGIFKFFKPSLKIDEYPANGAFSTINFLEFDKENDFTKPSYATSGTIYRFISSFKDSIIYTITPGGASGDVISPYYNNQTQLWLNGGYLKIPVNKKPGENYKLFLTLNPK